MIDYLYDFQIQNSLFRKITAPISVILTARYYFYVFEIDKQ